MWTKFKDKKPPFKKLIVICKGDDIYDIGEIIDKSHFKAMDGDVYTFPQDWYNDERCESYLWLSIDKP